MSISPSQRFHFAAQSGQFSLSVGIAQFLDFGVDDVLPNVGDEGRVVMIGAVQNAQFAFLQTKWLGKLFVELCHVQQVAIQSTDRVRIAIGYPRNGFQDGFETEL